MSSKHDPEKTCLNLRSKDMFYKVDDPEVAAQEKEEERLYGACETTAYWCQCTQTGRGPDDQPVGREECSRRDRKCFEGIHSIV